MLQDPVPADSHQVEAEAAAVARVAGNTCPVIAVLDRVVITGSGVVVACWQVSRVLGATLPLCIAERNPIN